MKQMNKYLSIMAAALLAIACVKDNQPEMLSEYFFGDGQSKPATYEQYLGTWRVGSRNIVLKENVKGVSYSLTDDGFGAQAETYHPTVYFESGKGTLAFRFESWMDSAKEWEVCFAGENGNDVLEGDSNANGLLARGKLSADGNSFTITAVSYTDSGNSCKATKWNLLLYHWIKTSKYDKGWYTYNDCEALSLPATLTR